MRTTPTELTNMILIENPQTHAILVEDRKNPTWPGVTFPGGHIEAGETVTESAIREAYEETGLTISQPQLVGIKEWPLDQDARYIVFLFHAYNYSGELKASREGEIFWTTRDELLSGKFQLPHTFAEMLQVFDQPDVNELALKPSQAPHQKWDLDWQ
ncbi:8-oxo-dGTP diphosphatase [Weissella uvarum]|uniref:8-oxo-dGTP diphosphatase n=1 Tax=Weissella uvarum TaxID=1479233 RepID=UPI0019603E6A|nr:8-oxo-dGTP diphosphatase [Weissella uvarum]MBM7617638.1 8-oxo-dGTP diphosphatase [Weissella uvarum]MCM0595987.1 8-oxo-dGTP diphosphatase [Weissella uvarum]